MERVGTALPLPEKRCCEIRQWVAVLSAPVFDDRVWTEAAVGLTGCGFEVSRRAQDATYAAKFGALSALLGVMRHHHPPTTDLVVAQCWKALAALMHCNDTTTGIVARNVEDFIALGREHLDSQRSRMVKQQVQLFICRVVGIEGALPHLAELAPSCMEMVQDPNAGDKMVQLATFQLLMIAQMARKLQDVQTRCKVQAAVDLMVFAELSVNNMVNNRRKSVALELVFELTGDDAGNPAMQLFLGQDIIRSWMVPLLEKALAFDADLDGSYTPDVLELLVVPSTSAVVAAHLIDAGVAELCVRAVLLDAPEDKIENVVTGQVAALVTLGNMAGHNAGLRAAIGELVDRPAYEGGLREILPLLQDSPHPGIRGAASCLRDEIQQLGLGTSLSTSLSSYPSPTTGDLRREASPHNRLDAIARGTPAGAAAAASFSARPAANPPPPLTTGGLGDAVPHSRLILRARSPPKRPKAMRHPGMLPAASEQAPRGGRSPPAGLWDKVSTGASSPVLRGRRLYSFIGVSFLGNLMLLWHSAAPQTISALAPSTTSTPQRGQDGDGDGIPDHHDFCNCKGSNCSRQLVDAWISGPVTDFDGDGCEDGVEDDDQDNDGVLDVKDNCPRTPQGYLFVSNSRSDFDGDGCQDGVEDTDDDGDAVLNIVDVCPETYPGEQQDPSGCSPRQLEARRRQHNMPKDTTAPPTTAAVAADPDAKSGSEEGGLLNLIRGAWVEVVIEIC